VFCALLGCALSCSWLVDPREDNPFCAISAVGAANVCPPGLLCQDGRCSQPCNRDAPDICNDNLDNDCDGNVDEIDPDGRDTCGDGRDNDCDGKVDEGSDFDNDGYSWCGNTVNTDGGGQDRDCDDAVASVHPGAREICDGRDNDCNGRTDEISPGSTLCEPGALCFNQRCVVPSCANEGPSIACGPSERCDPFLNACVSKKCADVTCAANEFCDEATKTCTKRQPLGNGAPCGDSTDCASGSCVDAAALRLASGTLVCAKACCSDEQCGKDERCFVSGTGARSCLPVARLPSMAQRECTTDEACGGNELCALSRDQTLAPPTFIAREDVITSTCQPNVPLVLQSGERCAFYTECATRACVTGYPFGNLCSNPCGTSSDCAELAKHSGGQGAYCRYVDVTLNDAPPDYAPICVVQRTSETGPGVYGAECSTGRDCLEAGCVGATATAKGHCTPTCCNDSQCSAREDGKPIRCRPFAFGARYEMRCDI
jgi:hypothetical protein